MGLFRVQQRRAGVSREGLNNKWLGVGIVNFYPRGRLAFHIQVVTSKLPCFDGANCRKYLRFSPN
jgi:hypothetical protein